MEWLVVPSILAVLFGGWKLISATRPATLKRLAQKLGWSYSRGLDRASALPEPNETMAIMYRGLRILIPMGTAVNVVTGKTKGRSFGICDIAFKAQPRDVRSTRLTLLFMRVERLSQFALGTQTPTPPPRQPACLRQGFRRQYLVDGLSDVQAEKVLKPGLQDWFENYPGYPVSVNPNHWVVIHRDVLMAPKDYRRTIDMAMRIAEVLEEHRK